MSRQRVLIFFGAHPDDETFGIGSTLAFYADRGVKVYYVCATRGESGEADPKFLKDFKSVGEMRWSELKCAANVLGLTDIIHLGYCDSGMAGSAQNNYPDSLTQAPVNEVAGRIVKIIRELKPEVVLTHDPSGGYRHPDHIAVHNATVKAFYAAADPSQYPEAGPAYQARKLYFPVRSHTLMRFLIFLMPLFGKDPHRFGINKDIDLTQIVKIKYPIHASLIIPERIAQIRIRAAACHASQGGGNPRRGPLVFRIMEKVRWRRDYFMRAYPPPVTRRESDLFESTG